MELKKKFSKIELKRSTCELQKKDFEWILDFVKDRSRLSTAAFNLRFYRLNMYVEAATQ